MELQIRIMANTINTLEMTIAELKRQRIGMLPLADVEKFIWEIGEDYHLWDEGQQGDYPVKRMLTAIQKLNKGAVMCSCPFCGSNELHFFEEPSRDKTVTWHRIQHSATNPCSISMLDSNKDNLIKMWNSRS